MTLQIRSSDVFLQKDIALILAALAMAAGNAPDEYRRGFMGALSAVAMAVGMAPNDLAAMADDWRVGR